MSSAITAELSEKKSDSTWQEKLTVAGTAFGFSSATFIFSVLLLVPTLGDWVSKEGAPVLVQQIVVFSSMFALPIIAALYGIHVSGKAVLEGHSKRRKE